MYTLLSATTRHGLLGLLLLVILPSLAHADGLLASTIAVRSADGSPVAGAQVCIGTASDPTAFGYATNDPIGQALIDAVLPDPPATVYLTATADGYGAQVVQQLSGTIAPLDLFVQIQLPATPGGPTCSGGGIVPPDLGGIEIDPADLMAEQIFAIRIFLDTPPVGPYPVYLVSSDPRLVTVPREVTFARGQRVLVVKGRVDPDVRQRTTVTIKAYTDHRRPIETRIEVKPDARNRYKQH